MKTSPEFNIFADQITVSRAMDQATDLLVKAVKYDNDNRKVEALSLYTEGINKLLDVAKGKKLAKEKDPLKYILVLQSNRTRSRNSTTTRR